jgi:dTMP kinase
MIITLEGPDGCGKTTVAAALVTALNSAGINAVGYRSPGGTRFGEAVRGIALDASLPADPWSLAILFMASEAESQKHYQAALAAGAQVVVADRGYLSNVAYRYADGIDIDRALLLAEACRVRPDGPIVVLSASPATRRARQRGRDGKDRFESRGEVYQSRVAEGYRRAAALVGATVLDAEKPIADIVTELARMVSLDLE